MRFTGRNLILLWWHCLRSGHQMAKVAEGMHAPWVRFCWQCDLRRLEAEIGEVEPPSHRHKRPQK